MTRTEAVRAHPHVARTLGHPRGGIHWCADCGRESDQEHCGCQKDGQ